MPLKVTHIGTDDDGQPLDHVHKYLALTSLEKHTDVEIPWIVPGSPSARTGTFYYVFFIYIYRPEINSNTTENFFNCISH